MTVASNKIDKRRIRGEESRRIILRAAVLSIAELGLGKTTLDRVAEKAGISRTLVVFHFKSKDKLIEEVLHYLGDTYARGWDKAFHKKSHSNIEKVLDVTDYIIRFAFENPHYVSAWHAFWGESKGNKLYHSLSFPRDENYTDVLKTLLANIVEEGGYDKRELDTIRTGLSAILFGVWVKSHLHPDPNNLNQYLQTVRLYLAKCFPDHMP